MLTFFIDCHGLPDESAFWNAYLDATDPRGAIDFGCNLDAFADALDGGPGWPGECQLRLINSQSLKLMNEGKLLAGLKDIAAKSKSVRISLE